MALSESGLQVQALGFKVSGLGKVTTVILYTS